MTLWQLTLKIFNAVLGIAKTVAAIKANQDQEIALLKQVLAAVLPPPPVSFTVTLESNPGELSMGRIAKATLDFQLLDNGSATATLSAVDSVGEPTTFPAGSTAVYTPSDPSIVASVGADGLTGTITPATPPVLATGVTVSVVVTLPGGATLSAVSPAIDVIAGGPAGFSIALS